MHFTMLDITRAVYYMYVTHPTLTMISLFVFIISLFRNTPTPNTCKCHIIFLEDLCKIKLTIVARRM